MAVTRYSSSDTLTVKAWQKQVMDDIRYNLFFNKGAGLMGEGPNNIIQIKSELGKGKGDTCYIPLLNTHEDDAGVQGSQVLEGNEARLVEYSDSVTLEKYRNAIRFEMDLNEIRRSYNIPAEARQLLARWGQVKLERIIFASLNASFTNSLYGGDATSSADLEAADKLTPQLISKAKVRAKTGDGQSQNKFMPVRIGGEEFYVMVVHPECAYDLKYDSTFHQAIREAEVRGRNNPIFTGALGVWDGVIIYESEFVASGTDAGAGSDVRYASNMLLGAQAGCLAWGKKGNMVVKDFDYEDEVGISLNMICGSNKNTFNSKDYACIEIMTSRTQLYSS